MAKLDRVIGQTVLVSAIICSVGALLCTLWHDLLGGSPNEMCSIYKITGKSPSEGLMMCAHKSGGIVKHDDHLYIFNALLEQLHYNNKTVRLQYAELRKRQEQGETLF